MNLYHLLSEQKSIDEAPMNPTAFAGAIEQGQGAGVLVGFEFEVHVPEATYKNKPAEEPDAPITINDLLEKLDFHKPLHMINFADLSPVGFDKLFPMREPLKGFDSVESAYNEYLKTLLPRAIETFNKIPPKTRAKIKDEAMRNIKNTTGRAFDSNSSDPRYQLNFADYVGKALYWDASQKLSDLGSDLRRVARRAEDYAAIIGWLTDDYKSNLYEQLPKYFDMPDPQAIWDTLNLDGYDEDDEDDEDENYEKAAKVLQPLIKDAMGRKVKIFSSYHEHAKNLTDWYIEPDGSLTADTDEDTSAEIVSPPLPVGEAIDALKKFYALAGQYGLYTNNTTGLHINVSIPLKLDLLKLAVFLGDQYVLKYFGREANDYARSVQKHLGKEVQRIGDVDLKKLQAMANAATSGHTSSISNNGKYISFRHAGGNYLQDYQGVFNVIGRFVRAMIIASDPTAYANEYQTKLAKLMQGPETNQIQKNTSLDRVLQFLRTKGTPIAVASLYTKRADAAKVATQGMKAYHIKLAPATAQVGAAAKTEIVNRVNQPEFKQKLTDQNDNLFVSLTFVPDSIKTLGQLAQVQFPIGVNKVLKVDDWNDTVLGYWFVEKIMLPPSDPRVQNLIKVLLRQQYAKK